MALIFRTCQLHTAWELLHENGGNERQAAWHHWRQTQSLLRSNRAGVRWLSQDLCPRREEIPTQSKVGGLAAKTSLDQLFVQYKCTVMDEINGHYLQLP